MNLSSGVRLAFALSFLVPVTGQAERKTEVDVVVDLTPEGRKVKGPTPSNPIYYLPVMGGYQALGAAVAGEPPPPPPNEVAHLVAVELAKQGYWTTQTHRQKDRTVYSPPPSLVLAIHWGYLNPVKDTPGVPDAGTTPIYNEDQMLALVGGNTLNNLDLGFEREGVIRGAEQNRYFVVVTAFDFLAYQKTRKRVQLWQAKMSVASNGVTLGEALPALVKAGGPLFGRETKRPQMLILPVTPEGRVDIGAPTVKDYEDAPSPAPVPSAKSP